MIVLAGASASGKTEVAKLLAKKYGITKIITTTTRGLRTGEVPGRDYFFVSVDEFKKMIEEDKFVEYTFFNGNFYGSTKDQVADDKCVVIDPAGLKSYIALKSERNIITFYLEADEETRKQRMIERGDSPEKIASRIENDRIAFKKENIAKVDYTIKNPTTETLEHIADQIYQIYSKLK